MPLPYTKTESFMLDGTSYPDERAALHAAIVKATGQNAGVATAIMKAAPLLGDLIARAVELDPPAPATAPAAVPVEPVGERSEGTRHQEHSEVLRAAGVQSEGDGSEHGVIMDAILGR